MHKQKNKERHKEKKERSKQREAEQREALLRERQQILNEREAELKRIVCSVLLSRLNLAYLLSRGSGGEGCPGETAYGAQQICRAEDEDQDGRACIYTHLRLLKLCFPPHLTRVYIGKAVLTYLKKALI